MAGRLGDLLKKFAAMSSSVQIFLTNTMVVLVLKLDLI